MPGIKLPAHLSKAASNMAIKSSTPKACKAFRSRDLPAAKALEVDWCEVLHQAALALQCLSGEGTGALLAPADIHGNP